MVLDTSGLLCYLDGAQAGHGESAQWMLSTRHVVTRSYVLAELVALAHVRGLPRSIVLEFLVELEGDLDIKVIFVDEELHRAGVDLLSRRLDKTYSLCDAVSFLLMSQLRVTDALTTDHHFEQAGFVRLLRPA